MATDVRDDLQPSVAGLVSGILQDAQQLVKQQFELLRQELRAEAHKAVAAIQMAATGLGIALVGAILLGIALALGLQAALPDLPLWASFAIFGVLIAVVGGVLFVTGLKQLSPVPSETKDALKESLPWTTNRN